VSIFQKYFGKEKHKYYLFFIEKYQESIVTISGNLKIETKLPKKSICILYIYPCILFIHCR